LSVRYIWNDYDQTFEKLFYFQHTIRNMYHVKQINRS